MKTYEELVSIRHTINPVKPTFRMVPENNAEHDLNWAYQQIRPRGKPAGNIEKYNNEAKFILESATGLSAEDAGEVICNYLRERNHFLNQEWEKALREKGETMVNYRAMEKVLYFSY